MANIIAIIKLAPGEVGYYDELTRIHLTLGRPSANVLDYMNTARLRRSVMGKALILVAGSLMPVTRFNDDKQADKKAKDIKKVAEPIVEPIVQKIVIAEPIVEAIIETVVPEPIVEKQEVVVEKQETETVEEIEITDKKSTTKKKKKED